VGGQDILLCYFLFVFPSLFFLPPFHTFPSSPLFSFFPISVPGAIVLALVTLCPRLIVTSEPCRNSVVRFIGKII